MSFDEKVTFSKDNLEVYLKALAKEYRKLGGKSVPAEIVLIGGASVLINYGFRDMTTDIDAVIRAASTMKDAINHVSDEYGLPNGWLNEDFKETSSYTPKLLQYSIFYKEYYGVMAVRTVSAEHLIAMKLMAGRQYKNDLSDIIGILAEHQKTGRPITKEMVREAVVDLYGEWDVLSDTAKIFIDDVMESGDYEEMHKEISTEEKVTKASLIEFEEKYPDSVNKGNVEEIIAKLKQKG